VGHIIARSLRPDLMFKVSNWQPEHRACSDKTGQSAVIAKAKAQALASVGFSPSQTLASVPAPSRIHIQAPMHIRPELAWVSHVQSPPTWLLPVLSVPGDASVPLAMTPVHPDAVDSYGLHAIDWVKTELGIELRWWQQLAVIRQLEHRADGSLCWRTILESCPRRAGKSVRLRAMALWRLAHHDQFGEQQLVLHTGKDVAIVREIHRQAWRWAQERDDWDVRKGVGQEEVRLEETERWLVRSTDSVYGYDVTLGMVDEAWAVDPATYEEGLEPATLERSSPQLLLTSTAHRRATSLMRKKLTEALADDDSETLLMFWGARPQDDPADPATWQASSPHWTQDRARMIASKYAKALAGEADVELDDPDPMAGFTAQYLNIWRLEGRSQAKGDALISEDEWAELQVEVPTSKADAVAIESWFADGVTVAYAWKDGTVLADDYPDLATAAAVLMGEGYTGTLIVGASLADDPALKGMRVTKGTNRTAAAVQDVSRFLKDGTLRHAGTDHLTNQVLGVRTLPASDGVRVTSRERADAIKAVAWAVKAARKPGRGKPRILMPTAS
jgi:phage terminase large subunit-like protein